MIINKNINPLISIIIRTKNEVDWIESCIDAINFQDYKNFEIIIVDNNSTDGTLRYLKKLNLKVLKIKKYLPGKALNLGIKNSMGSIIVCLSAHCIPKNNKWLSNLISPLVKKKEVVAVYGKQEPYSYSNALDKRDLINTFGLDRKIQKKDPFFHNANSAFTKKIWNKFPFDEKVPNIEDRIWGKILIDNNLKIQYEPSSSVYHWHGINQSQDEARAESIIKILESHKNFFSYQNKTPYSNKSEGVAIIPIRGEDITNFEELDKTIDQILSIKKISNIIISTDDKKVLDYVNNNKKMIATSFRPKNLSNKFTDIFEVAKFTIKNKLHLLKKIDFVILLQIDYPNRNTKIINKMINHFIKKQLNSLVAAKIEKRSFEIFNSNKSRKHISHKNLAPKSLKEDKLVILLTGLCTLINFRNLINDSWRYENINYYEVNDVYSIKSISEN